MILRTISNYRHPLPDAAVSSRRTASKHLLTTELENHTLHAAMHKDTMSYHFISQLSIVRNFFYLVAQ